MKLGRRLIGAAIGAVLLTVAYYITMKAGIDIAWFKTYAAVLGLLYGLGVLGWTATDIASIIRK